MTIFWRVGSVLLPKFPSHGLRAASYAYLGLILDNLSLEPDQHLLNSSDQHLLHSPDQHMHVLHSLDHVLYRQPLAERGSQRTYPLRLIHQTILPAPKGPTIEVNLKS